MTSQNLPASDNSKARPVQPTPLISAFPVLYLLVTLVTVIYFKGASAVQEYSPLILLSAAFVGLLVSLIATPRRPKSLLAGGIRQSAKQILPTLPILLFIGTLASTWMLSGIIPAMIDSGLKLMNPGWFLPVTCAICSAVSVLTGSSWTTIATVGVGFMGIGGVMGYEPEWIAGAVISGAYFGDKVSPLSDTTVLAAASCNVPLTVHIRNLMWTSMPALLLALGVYSCVGLFTDFNSSEESLSMAEALRDIFTLSPWLFAVPLLTAVLIILRVPTPFTLAVGSLAGLAAMYIFQPHIVAAIADSHIRVIIDTLFLGASLPTGNELLDPLVSTGGMFGMIPTIMLILSAMIFGGVMIGTGMLGSLTASLTRSIRSSKGIVAATCGSGLFLNSCTGDQYLSIIVGGNIFRDAYRERGLRPSTLSRTLEDSVSVTSVLIPWNSCGITQSTVLGVATLAYLPYCIFNLCSPVMTLLLAMAGWKIRESAPVNDALTRPDASPAAVRVSSN